MMHSLGKLRKFAALHRGDTREKSEIFPPAQLDELAQASKDMQSMKNCYDSLLSAAAATANSAYEFSESLQEMGTCLIEKTSLHGDEESGRLLSMLGKVQFELQQLVDTYRSHIFLTITNPSESFLSELRTVEEMKKQCDEKRDTFEYMMAQHKEKGKSKSGKGESLASQQLQRAREEYEDEANLCVFRLKSLKQGQSRSLLTQASRHHAAQLNFFRKGLKSLEAVDSHVKTVAEQQHIDYQSSVIEDDGQDGDDDGQDGFSDKEDGELSFDYRRGTVGMDLSTSRNSMEVDDLSFSHQPSTAKNAEANLDRSQVDIQFSSREPRLVSHSAPIFPEKKFDPAEKLRHMQHLATQKPNSYVLPTPTDSKGTVQRTKPSGPGGLNHNLWHSLPLEQKKHDSKAVPEIKESKTNNGSAQLPPPLTEGGLVSDMEKMKRQAFSGPLTSKPVSKKPVLSTSGPISPSELPQLVSGMLSRAAQPSTSPKVSPSASPPLSSPRISELHELPRPPGNLSARPAKSLGLVGHSAPLTMRSQEVSAANKIPATASPLPAPPLVVARSYSIPSSSQRAMTLNVAKILEAPHAGTNVGQISSPPLTPISLADMKPATSVAAMMSHSGSIRGAG